jgi:hypothetical protein
MLADQHVGRPFVIAPGNPPDHKVAWDLADGTKMRIGGVMQAWNDALLMDAINGRGSYRKHADTMSIKALWVGELLYGLTFDEMLDAWLQIPKYTSPCIWKQGAKEWTL